MKNYKLKNMKQLSNFRQNKFLIYKANFKKIKSKMNKYLKNINVRVKQINSK